MAEYCSRPPGLYAGGRCALPRTMHLNKVHGKTNWAPRHVGDHCAQSYSGLAPANTIWVTTSSIYRLREGVVQGRVVEVAEKEGKGVELLVVPAVNPFDAMADTASRLRASRLVTGVSRQHGFGRSGRGRSGGPGKLGCRIRGTVSLEVISPDRPSTFVNLGPHPPRLWPEDAIWCTTFGST